MVIKCCFLLSLDEKSLQSRQIIMLLFSTMHMKTKCLFCHSGVQAGDEAYITHLSQYHRIQFDVDHILKRTQKLLELQRHNLPTSHFNTFIVEIVNDIVATVAPVDKSSEN